MSAKEMFEELGYELVNKAPMLWQFNDGGFIKNAYLCGSRHHFGIIYCLQPFSGIAADRY